MNLQEKDRIGQYLTPQLSKIVFDELSEGYLEKAGLADILTGVPVPLQKNELNNISMLSIAKCMAFVIGCDPEFKYRDNYIAYIKRIFDTRFADALIAEGVEAAASKKAYDYACILFRGAMQIEPDNVNAYYCYGRACKDAYEAATESFEASEEAEEFVGRFKAEALEAFEVATLKDPQFADAYYFLGYAYLNMGLYVKAQLTWQEYMKLTAGTAGADEEIRKEIAERLKTLERPVEIEKGYNLVISGRYEEGIAMLEEYKDSEFASWWPLWFYLGAAHEELGEVEEAISCFTEALKYSPSNIECMEELVKLYEKSGDAAKVEKYSKKIQLVKQNAEKDRQLWKEEKLHTKLN